MNNIMNKMKMKITMQKNKKQKIFSLNKRKKKL